MNPVDLKQHAEAKRKEADSLGFKEQDLHRQADSLHEEATRLDQHAVDAQKKIDEESK